MKQTDIQQGRRLARLVDQLTREELTYVEIAYDNPDAEHANEECAVTFRDGFAQLDGKFGETVFHGSSVIDCLLQALKARDLVEEVQFDGSEYEARLVDKADRSRRVAEAVHELLRAIEDDDLISHRSQVEKLRFIALEANALREILVGESTDF